MNMVCDRLQKAEDFVKNYDKANSANGKRDVFMGVWSINQAFETGDKMVKAGTATNCTNIVF